MQRLLSALVLCFGLAGCVVTPVVTTSGEPSSSRTSATGGQSPPSEQARIQVANFLEVVDRVEPVAESICQQETRNINCDFQILVDRDPRLGVNAFQTEDMAGRPLIVFTLGMIAVAENTDELAFVMGHEAGHHIARHLPQVRAEARAGAELFGAQARARGADERTVSEAAQLGAIVAQRRFTQSAELEADALGARIALAAGYDALRGAAFFDRLPDPSDQFLASHPPNAERQAIVRQTVAQLR